MTKLTIGGIGIACVLAVSSIATAQPMGGMPMGQHPAPMGQHGGMSQDGYMSAMQTMHAAMMRASDRDPARAWALMMIEHHRGAIAMSRVVLGRTRDPDIRRMANHTIAAQTREIGEMQRWLDRHGGRQPHP